MIKETRKGDAGMTSLARSKNIPKSDDRIQLVGSLEELTGSIGVIKSLLGEEENRGMLEKIQRTLGTISDGISDPYAFSCRIKEEEVVQLEQETARLQTLFPEKTGEVLPGADPLSAQIDLTRSVERRCERALSLVSVRYGADACAKKYMNRLGDYFWTLARYEESRAEQKTQKPLNPSENGEKDMDAESQRVVQEVIKRIGQQESILLDQAKRLIDRVEAYAEKQGLKAVIAVCNPQGNPVAVHVMDGAFLVSFDVAVKKAWTSAAVKMSTMALSELIKPGGTFQGLDKLQEDKMVFFGGGVPLEIEGRLVGALGVSGGTGEQDHGIARYGAGILEEIW